MVTFWGNYEGISQSSVAVQARPSIKALSILTREMSDIAAPIAAIEDSKVTSFRIKLAIASSLYCPRERNRCSHTIIVRY